MGQAEEERSEEAEDERAAGARQATKHTLGLSLGLFDQWSIAVLKQ
jgi:hypothetical protein